jgi:hypothetical protein
MFLNIVSYRVKHNGQTDGVCVVSHNVPERMRGFPLFLLYHDEKEKKT